MIVSDFTKQEYSKQDFLQLIEHRIRKEIRVHHLLDSKQSYTLEEQSLQSQVLLYFLRRIFKDRLHFEPASTIIVTDFLELYVSKRLDVFLNKGDESMLEEKSIAPLRSITQHEVQEVARILDIKGTITLVQQSIIDDLAKKYPQTKPSFLKSFLHIEQLEKS